jgi:hypothetical protein
LYLITSMRPEPKREGTQIIREEYQSWEHAEAKERRNEEPTAQHRAAEIPTEQEAYMTTQGKQARNLAPPHATQAKTLQCGVACIWYHLPTEYDTRIKETDSEVSRRNVSVRFPLATYENSALAA